MPFIDGVEGPAYYRHWEAEVPRGNVLVLHGYGEHSGLFHRLAVALTLSGFDVWGIDHIGHGLTGGERGYFTSVENLAENSRRLLALIAKTSAVPVAIVGHSLGGVTAALLALNEPEPDSLVLSGTPIPSIPPDAAALVDPVLSVDPFYLDALTTDPLAFDAQPAWEAANRSIAAAGSVLDESLSSLRMPTLLINGEFDVFAPPSTARSIAARLPDASAIEVSGAYHNVVNDRAHFEVERVIVDFVARRGAS